MLTLLYIVGGIAGLFYGGEWLVTAGAAIGQRLGVSRLIIGLTVVAFGTSCPELATTLEATLSGSSDLAFGNVVGSNIANVGLVLGIGTLLTQVKATRRFMMRDVPAMLGSSLLAWYFAADGVVDRVEGGVLLGVLVVYLAVLVRGSRHGDDTLLEDVPDEDEAQGMGRAALKVAAGIALLVLGAELLVQGGVATARHLGVSERAIGLSLVAVGTSLPELASTVIACVKGQDDMAIGNIVGSNIFNVLAILGTTSSVSPVTLDVGPLPIDMGTMLLLSVLVPLFTARAPAGRPAGVILLTIYASYMVALAYRGA